MFILARVFATYSSLRSHSTCQACFACGALNPLWSRIKTLGHSNPLLNYFALT